MFKFLELLKSSNTSCIRKIILLTYFTPSNYGQNSYIEVNATIQYDDSVFWLRIIENY